MIWQLLVCSGSIATNTYINESLLIFLKKNMDLILEIKLEDGAKMPKKGEANAMCYDCYAYKMIIREDGKVEIDLGFSIKPPKGYGIRLIPRSSLSKYWWVMNNSIGIGDEDYKGTYKAIFTPIPVPDNKNNPRYYEEFPYKIFERCCQMEIYKREDFEFKIVDKLSGNDRGGGFGSTGNS